MLEARGNTGLKKRLERIHARGAHRRNHDTGRSRDYRFPRSLRVYAGRSGRGGKGERPIDSNAHLL